MSVMWALSEYTSDNGSTLIVPGSHLWDHDSRPDPHVAARYSEQVQRLLGYSVFDGLFYGHVDGRDPIKLIGNRAI